MVVGTKYIPPKREETLQRENLAAIEEKRAAETAPTANGVGEKLAALARALRSGRQIDELSAYADFAADIYVNGDPCDPNVQRADELLSEIEYLLYKPNT
jgi:hypothetical protein